MFSLGEGGPLLTHCSQLPMVIPRNLDTGDAQTQSLPARDPLSIPFALAADATCDTVRALGGESGFYLSGGNLCHTNWTLWHYNTKKPYYKTKKPQTCAASSPLAVGTLLPPRFPARECGISGRAAATDTQQRKHAHTAANLNVGVRLSCRETPCWLLMFYISKLDSLRMVGQPLTAGLAPRDP